MSDRLIGDFLASLGLTGAVAERGRAVLEAEGITNPRKSRLSEAKLERARAAIDARFARLCASCAARTDAGGREIVTVAHVGMHPLRRLAERSRARRARRGMRVRRPTPARPRRWLARRLRRELGALDGPLELRLIDGTARRTGSEAQRDLDWADLVLIAGSSELGHKVSNLYTKAGSATAVVTVPRRGVEAIAAAVVEHVRRRA